MDYFKLFNIKPTYEINADELQSAYLLLQKKYHPDNCESIDDQLQAVEKTIEINEAFDVLSDDVSLIVYFLKIDQSLELSSVDIQTELSQDDLMFLLDLQEEISNNIKNIEEYKQILKKKTSSIALKVKTAIQTQNNKEIKTNLAKLIFFTKSLKHIG